MRATFYHKKNLLLFTLLFFSCCSLSNDRKEAEAIVENLFNLLKSQQFIDTTTLYSDSFFVNFDRDEWPAMLKERTASSGLMKSYEQTGYHVIIVTNKGKKIFLEYETLYSKKTLKERFALSRDPQTGRYKIFTHHAVETPLMTGSGKKMGHPLKGPLSKTGSGLTY